MRNPNLQLLSEKKFYFHFFSQQRPSFIKKWFLIKFDQEGTNWFLDFYDFERFPVISNGSQWLVMVSVTYPSSLSYVHRSLSFFSVFMHICSSPLVVMDFSSRVIYMRWIFPFFLLFSLSCCHRYFPTVFIVHGIFHLRDFPARVVVLYIALRLLYGFVRDITHHTDITLFNCF